MAITKHTFPLHKCHKLKSDKRTHVKIPQKPHLITYLSLYPVLFNFFLIMMYICICIHMNTYKCTQPFTFPGHPTV